MRGSWGQWYWPVWFWLMLVTLLGPEVYALFSNSRNTLSNWVWMELDVTTDHAKTWSALHFLVFGIWVVAMVWLTGHFFYRRWT